MISEGIIHPQLLELLSSMGHTDTIVVADAGLPIPSGVQRVDLAWYKNCPRLLPVLMETLKEVPVQKAYLAEEIKTHLDSEIYHAILDVLGDIEVEYIAHDLLKAKSAQARGVVRTGEYSPYPNVILECGCAF